MPGRIQLVLPADSPADSRADIEGAMTLARALGAQVTAAVMRTDPALATHWLAREYAAAQVADIDEQAIANADTLKQAAIEAARRAGVELFVAEVLNGVVGGEKSAVMVARTHDLSVLGVIDQDAGRRRLAEELIFDSGRPLFVLPLSRPFGLHFERVAIAWDHSESVSRVLSGALPVLKLAKEACIFAIPGARKGAREEAVQEAAAYLRSHGINAAPELLESEDRARGRFMMEAAIARGAGLLVMGAYSTPRASEYVLGGVTLSVLNEPLLPTLMAN